MTIKKLLLIIGVPLVIISVGITFYISLSKKVFFPREGTENNFTEKHIVQKIEFLQQKLNLSQDDIQTRIELGIYYFLKGPEAYHHAINLLDSAWRMGSSDARIFYYLGCMYEFLKLYNFAIAEYKKYLVNVPDDIEVKIRLGNVYYYSNKLDDAINIYDDILNKDKNNIVVLTNLGMIFFNKKNYIEAQQYFTKVKTLCKNKNIVEPQYINFSLGKIFFLNKNYESAKQYFEQEINLYPNDVQPYIFLVKTLIELKDIKNATTICRNGLKISSENKDLKLLLYKLTRRK